MNVFDQSPPHDEHSERMLLSGFISVPGAFFENRRVRSDWFYTESHRLIFVALATVLANDQPEDVGLATLVGAELIRRQWIAGITHEYLREVSDAMFLPTLDKVAVWAESVRVVWLRRRALFMAHELAAECSTADDPEVLLEHIADTIADTMLSTDNTNALSALADEWFESIERLRSGETTGEVVPTGVKPLDELTGGVALSRMVVLVAKSGYGKTRFAVRVAYELARKGWFVEFFSHEMTPAKMTQLFATCEDGLEYDAYVDPTHRDFVELEAIADDQRQRTRDAISELHVNVYTGKRTIREIVNVTKARRAQAGDAPVLLVVDYVQAMKVERPRGVYASAFERYSEISERLSGVARDANVCVLALTQFNKAGGKADRPSISDIDGTEQLRKDADEIFILHNPEIEEKQRGVLEGALYLEKDRHGVPGEVDMRIDLGKLTFEKSGRPF